MRSDRQNKTEGVGDALNRMIREFGIENKFDLANLRQNWGEIVGPVIAQRTEKIYLKDSCLHIKVSSAPLRNELQISKTQLLQKIVDFMGKSPITDLKIL